MQDILLNHDLEDLIVFFEQRRNIFSIEQKIADVTRRYEPCNKHVILDVMEQVEKCYPKIFIDWSFNFHDCLTVDDVPLRFENTGILCAYHILVNMMEDRRKIKAIIENAEVATGGFLRTFQTCLTENQLKEVWWYSTHEQKLEDGSTSQFFQPISWEQFKFLFSGEGYEASLEKLVLTSRYNGNPNLRGLVLVFEAILDSYELTSPKSFVSKLTSFVETNPSCSDFFRRVERAYFRRHEKLEIKGGHNIETRTLLNYIKELKQRE